jgi:V/A-type H+-transporting ATPase subunit I
VDELISSLPDVPAAESYLEPRRALEEAAKVIDRHLLICRESAKKRDELNKELEDLKRYSPALDAMEQMLAGMEEAPDVELFGLTLKEAEVLPRLDKVLEGLTDGKSAVRSLKAGDGTLVAIIVTAGDFARRVRETLYREQIPELRFPSGLKDLTLPGKVAMLRKRQRDVAVELRIADERREAFSCGWGPLYRRAQNWIRERLAVLAAQGFAYQTESCFLFYGWVPEPELPSFGEKLEKRFGGQVVAEEREILQEELELVPILLRNPAYFSPFELFTRLLPLPRYTSYDPTPFLAIFFPIFFGMILGDAGYGIVLFAAASWLGRRYRANRNVRDAARILRFSSLYTIIFGLFYGEFFGDIGRLFFGLGSFLERKESVLPMLYFAMAVGIFHVVFGLVLGIFSALRKKAGRDALSRLLSLLIITAAITAVGSLFGIIPKIVVGPMIYVILILLPMLVVAGGFLAFLELLKSIGNIISYARLMAIGLASVLLAFVANRIAGLAGDVFIGLLAGLLLHTINILLGILSPTIHSVRLHYVEFFGKFIEPGGRKYEPLGKS